jgi:hypothetical protein
VDLDTWSFEYHVLANSGLFIFIFLEIKTSFSQMDRNYPKFLFFNRRIQAIIRTEIEKYQDLELLNMQEYKNLHYSQSTLSIVSGI